jgi:TonB family protein
MLRWSAVLGASVLLHGAGLAVLDGTPLGRAPGSARVSVPGSGPLHASLRPVPLSQNLAAPRTEPLAEREAEPTPARTAVGSENNDQRGRPQTAGSLLPREAGLGPAPERYRLSELDEAPQPRNHIEPDFPIEANIPDGTVHLQLNLDEAGRVEEVLVLRAIPPGIFEVEAAQAFMRAEFTPGRIRGIAVKTSMTIEVMFGTPVPIPPGQAQALRAPLEPPAPARLDTRR